MRRERFTDLLAAIIDNRGRTCPVTDVGTPLIATNCVRNELLYPIFEKIRFVSDATYDTWFRGHPKPGDIIFVCKGTPGRVCLAPDPVGFCIAQDMVAVRADPKKIYPRFLFALLRSSAVQTQIENMHVGSLIPHFKKGDFDKLFLDLPEPSIQRFVGDFYFDLSSKIDLNRKMSATLEAMARALFKSWFVDFDPVRAKANGHTPSGMDVQTAKLFPSEVVDSEMGPIPKGWHATTLGTELERCGGAVQTGPFGSQLHASDYVPEGVPVVMPKDIGGRRVSTASIARVREDDAVRLSRHRLQPGDVVYSRRGDVERHALIGTREAGWLCGTGCLLVRLGPRWPSPAFASFALDRPETRAWLSQHAIGATMPNLNTGILSAVPLIVPPYDVMGAFAAAVDSLESLIVARDAESSSLAEIRDELLPRLLAGSIDAMKGAV